MDAHGAVPVGVQPVVEEVTVARPRSVVGFACAFALGAGVAYLGFRAFTQLSTVLHLVAFAVLIGVTLDPLVQVLVRRGMRRPMAGLLVWLAAVALLSAPLVLAVDAASTQLPGLIKSAPDLISNAEDHLGSIGRSLKKGTSSSTSSVSINSVFDYVLVGGQLVFNALTDFVVVGFLSLYFAIELPRLKSVAVLVVPASRRSSIASLVDDLITEVGKFMLSTIAIAIFFGVGTGLWCLGWGVPYPVLLGSLVAVFALIPVVGSTLGGVLVTLVSLTVGIPVAIATLIFYVSYRLAEDYVIQPRIMRFSVELPGVITVPSVILGGAILGAPGALFAVPVALIVRSLIREFVFPAADRR